MNLQDRKYMAQYSDEELMQMEYDAMKKECLKYRVERDSWRNNFEELKIKYQELQNIYVETEDELNEYRDKFVNEALQHNYLKNDYDYLREDVEHLKERLSFVERRISNANGSLP